MKYLNVNECKINVKLCSVLKTEPQLHPGEDS